MQVVIINRDEAQIDEKALTAWILRVCEELKSVEPQILKKNVTVAFVNQEEIQKLNYKFRKKNQITDILSFAPVEKGFLGELVICLSVLSEKKLEDFSKKQWLYYLVLHGLLHLLGFEHEKKEAEAQKMYALQDSIFEKLKEF